MVIYWNVSLGVNGKIDFIKRIGICIDRGVGDDVNRHDDIWYL